MQENTCMIPISSNHLTVPTFCLFRSAMADSVYKNGFMAELIGRTRTAIQAYTSADMSARSVSARIPVIKHHEYIWIKLRKKTLTVACDRISCRPASASAQPGQSVFIHYKIINKT